MFKEKKSLMVLAVLYFAMVILYSLEIDGVFGVLIEGIPGVIGVLYFLSSNFSKSEIFLQFRKISKKGIAVLMIFYLFLAPILLAGRIVGFSPLGFFVIAPISALGQELFFRSTLLVGLSKTLKNKKFALLIHAFLFSLWHIPVVVKHAPVPGIVSVAIVTFVGGLIWGWQVMRDKTIFWVVLQHTSYLMLMSLFVW